MIPVLLFEFNEAIIVSIVWGFIAIGTLSYFVAKNEGERPLVAIREHLFITAIVVILTHYLGDLVRIMFI